MFGGVGSDRLVGGRGVDYLGGGDGNDHFDRRRLTCHMATAKWTQVRHVSRLRIKGQKQETYE
jgi:hypothetical protein